MYSAHYFMAKERQQTQLAVQRYRAAAINTQLCYRQTKATTLSVIGSPTGLGIAFGLGCVSGLDNDSKGQVKGIIDRVVRTFFILF